MIELYNGLFMCIEYTLVFREPKRLALHHR